MLNEHEKSVFLLIARSVTSIVTFLVSLHIQQSMGQRSFLIPKGSKVEERACKNNRITVKLCDYRSQIELSVDTQLYCRAQPTPPLPIHKLQTKNTLKSGTNAASGVTYS